MKLRTKTAKSLCRTLALATIACLLVCLLVPFSAFAANSKVTDCADGVFQVNLEYRDDNNTKWVFAFGSGFLINNNTIVTCAHVIDMSDDDIAVYAEYFGKSVAEFKDRLSYSITVARDVKIAAEKQQISLEMDFAILHLTQSIQNATALTIRTSSVERTEAVFAIGFPSESAEIQNIPTYTSDDATITQGQVNKIDHGALANGGNAEYLQTSCKLTGGNSGGPMVDENGYVVGVCEGWSGTTDTGDDYFYAVTIRQVTQICDALGIAYTSDDAASEPAETEAPAPSNEPAQTEPPAPQTDFSGLNAAIDEASAISADGYTAESFAALQTALDAARTAKATAGDQTQIDSAKRALQDAIDGLKHEESSNLTLILIIAGVVVAAIVAIIIIVLASSSKKKKAAAARQTAARAPMAPAAPRAPVASAANAGFAPTPMAAPAAPRPGTVPLNPDVGETTILNQGAGETTVLSQNVNGGYLVRLSNRERINVNKAELTIGRERKRVDYCISDNTSISRVHAKIVIRDGKAFLVDMNAANGTFVNGIKAAANQEVPLKDGDKITLAAEDFEYHA